MGTRFTVHKNSFLNIKMMHKRKLSCTLEFQIDCCIMKNVKNIIYFQEKGDL